MKPVSVSDVFDDPVEPVAVQVAVSTSDFSFSVARLLLRGVGVGVAVLVAPEVVLKNVRFQCLFNQFIALSFLAFRLRPH